MKSEAVRPAGTEKEWTPGGTLEPFLVSSPGAVSLQRSERELPAREAFQQERTRIFLHQLSQTLTSLRGILELALLVAADEQEYKAVIQKSLAQAESLVQLFKSYRKAEEDPSPAVMHESVSLRDLVVMAVEQLRPIANSREIAVRINAMGDCIVRTDAARLLVAFRQGLLRAIQRTPTGSHLTVGISASEGDAFLTISALAQGGETAVNGITGHVPGGTFPVADAKGDWHPLRKAIEVLGGTVVTSAVESSPLFCRICLPLAGHERL